MSEHTPGPWLVDETNGLGIFGIWTDAADRLSTNPMQICSMLQTQNSCGAPKEQRAANGRLIAAAPDLLEACQAFVARSGLTIDHANA